MILADPLADLMRDRVDALYSADAKGRIVATNEWDGRPAPRFHLMRTVYGPILKCRQDLPDDLVARLQALCDEEPMDRALEPTPAGQDAFLALFSSCEPVAKVWAGPAYMVATHLPRDGETVAIDEANADLLAERLAEWLPDVPHRRPFRAVVEDGHAVALCASVRISPMVHCAGVETHPDYRRKGYARQVVAAWTEDVMALGATPFYSTSWDNLASQGVAKALDLTLAGVDFHVT